MYLLYTVSLFRHVLELGSGAGLVGLSICSMTRPSSYCFTDYHPHVLSLLSHNVHLNFPGIAMSIIVNYVVDYVVAYACVYVTCC